MVRREPENNLDEIDYADTCHLPRMHVLMPQGEVIVVARDG